MNYIKKMLPVSRNALALILGLSMGSLASAAQYDLLLTAVGGDHDGETLWSFGPPPDFTFLNVSTVDVDESITWGDAGTTGTFIAADIEVNYFGTIYDLSDAVAPVTVEWLNGHMVGINYITADFSLDFAPINNPKEWSGNLVVSEVPTPGALALFSLALGSLGLRSVRRAA